MKINSYKIKLAQKFLNELKKEISKIKTKETLVLDTYANGREAGYHLSCCRVNDLFVKWGCSFSESRGSDQLAVYIGLGFLAFDMAGNIPNESVYRSKTFFNEGDMKKAAAYITTSLKVFLSSAAKEVLLAKV